MKKVLMAAVAFMAVPFAAQAGIVGETTVDTGVCNITITDYEVAIINTEFLTIGHDDVACLEDTISNRQWLNKRLGTQVHYYNKATELLGVDSVGDNGAYWGDVTAARTAIEDLKSDVATAEAAQAAAEATAFSANQSANEFQNKYLDALEEAEDAQDTINMLNTAITSACHVMSISNMTSSRNDTQGFIDTLCADSGYDVEISN